MAGVLFGKPQAGVPGWGVGSGNPVAGGLSSPNLTAIGNAGGLTNLFTGKVNNPFNVPSMGPQTSVDPYAAGGVYGPGGSPSENAGATASPMPAWAYKQYGSPLPPAGPTRTPATTPDFLSQLMASILNPGSSGTVKSSYDLKGALGDIAGIYKPELSALDKLVAQKKGMSNDNSAKLKALYASLVAGTQASGVQGDQHYTDLKGKQSASTQAERDAITARYNQQLSDMQKQMADSGFANLIPVRTQKLQDQMNRELANINTQGDIAQNQSTGLQGSQHNWYGESANVNAGQGVNAQAANMRQLQDALSQIDAQRATVLSNQAKDQASANQANRASISAAQSASNKASIPDYALALKVWQAQQDQKTATTKAAAGAAQQKFDNAVKAYQAGKGVLSATTGQSTMDPNALAQIMAGMG